MEWTPNLSMMRVRCVSTVCRLSPRRAAISLFDRPSASKMIQLPLTFREKLISILELLLIQTAAVGFFKKTRHRWAEICFARLNLLDCFDEAFLECVLEQISASPGLDSTNNIPFVAIHAQDQHGCFGRMTQHLTGSLDTVQFLHRDVDDRDIRLMLFCNIDRFQSGARLCDDLKAFLPLQNAAESLSEKVMIVRK